MNKLFPLLIIVGSLIGCSSLPFPHTPTESLLVAACSMEREISDGTEKITDVVLIFSTQGKESTEKVTLRLPVSGEFSVVKCESGMYLLESAEITRREAKLFGKKTTDTVDFNREVNVRPRTVHLVKEKCVLSNGGNRGYAIAFTKFTGEQEKTAVFDALQDDRGWIGWERYELVNFPE